MKQKVSGTRLCLGIAMLVAMLILQYYNFFGLLDFMGGHDQHISYAVTLLPATALQQVNLLTEEAWTPNQAQIDMNTIDALSFQKQLAMQKGIGAPLVRKLTDTEKDFADVKVWWRDFCGQEAEDCTTSGADLCGDLSGDPTGLDSKTYNITQCLNDQFSINENEFAGSWMDLQAHLVQEQNHRVINFLNALNKKYLLALHAHAGLNKGGFYNADGQMKYEVPSNEFDDTKIVTKMLWDAELSNVRNPFLLTGDRQMFITLNNAKFNSGNAEGKGDSTRGGVFDVTMDARGFVKTPTLAGSLFMVTPYASAFVSKNYYPNSAPIYDNDLKKFKYSINIENFGIRIDVLHQRVCIDAAKDRWKHYFNYRLHYDFLFNPYGCLDDVTGKKVTGIIEYQNLGGNVGSS